MILVPVVPVNKTYGTFDCHISGNVCNDRTTCACFDNRKWFNNCYLSNDQGQTNGCESVP